MIGWVKRNLQPSAVVVIVDVVWLSLREQKTFEKFSQDFLSSPKKIMTQHNQIIFWFDVW